MKEYLGNIYDDKINYIKILAKEKNIGNNRQKVLSFGLNELKEITLSRIGNATKSSYYQSIKEKLVYLYKKEINKKFAKIKNNIL